MAFLFFVCLFVCFFYINIKHWPSALVEKLNFLPSSKMKPELKPAWAAFLWAGGRGLAQVQLQHCCFTSWVGFISAVCFPLQSHAAGILMWAQRFSFIIPPTCGESVWRFISRHSLCSKKTEKAHYKWRSCFTWEHHQYNLWAISALESLFLVQCTANLFLVLHYGCTTNNFSNQKIKRWLFF